MSPSLKTIPTPPTMIWWVDCLPAFKHWHCAKSEIVDEKKQVAVSCQICWTPFWDVFRWWSSKPEIFFLLADLFFAVLLYHADSKYLLCLHRNPNTPVGALSCHTFPARRFLCSLLFLEFPHHCSTSVHRVRLRTSVMNRGRCGVVSMVSRPRVGRTRWQPDRGAECAQCTGGIILCIKWFMSSLYSVSADIWIFLRALSQSSRRKVTAVT